MNGEHSKSEVVSSKEQLTCCVCHFQITEREAHGYINPPPGGEPLPPRHNANKCITLFRAEIERLRSIINGKTFVTGDETTEVQWPRCTACGGQLERTLPGHYKCVVCCLLNALEPRETTAPQGESGWLIELPIKGVPHWLMVSSVREWTSDANKAVRFAREGDADAMLFFLGLEDAKATGHERVASSPEEPPCEHVWIGGESGERVHCRKCDATKAVEPKSTQTPDSRGDAALWVLAWLAMKGGLGSYVHEVIEAVMEGRAEMRPNNKLHIEPRNAEKASEDPRIGEVRALMQAYRKRGALSSTDKVRAVNLYRAIHGCGLKEAVFACDTL